MSDLRDAIRRAAERHEPPEDWLGRIYERARKRRRNQRVVAGVVGLGFALILVVALLVGVAARKHLEPAGRWEAPDSCGSGTKIAPTGWWRGDGSGADAAGGDVAVLHGGVTYVPGIVGGAFSFDGNDDWVEVPYDPALDVGARDFTLTFWVKFTSTPGNRQVLLENWIETFVPATSRGWSLINPNDRSIALVTGGGSGMLIAHRLTLPVGTWIHVAVRRSAQRLSAFVNGSLAGTESIAGSPPEPASNASLKFGHRGDSSDTPGSRDHRGFFLHGDLDEVELFVGHGLSNSQIRQIFQAQSSCSV
jgi:hypothetical protein